MPHKLREDRAKYMREYRANKRKAKENVFDPGRLDPKKPLGQIVAEWAEKTLKVPTGPLRGQSFVITEWQRQFLIDALGEGIRESGLSVARKNGKSGVIAALLLAYLCGPLNSPEWRGIVVSLTGNLATELRTAIDQTATISEIAHLIDVRKSPFPGSIYGQNGARLSILASDKATGHALGSDLAVIDEAGLIPESQRELWNAILSSTSGRDGRLLCISIRGDGPMFTELAERAGEPSVVWHEYAASEGCALDDESAWEAANPGLADGIKSIGYMRDTARRAISTPADAASFRAYDLNQPQNPSRELLCDVADWLACESEDLPGRSGDYVIGFDIGGSSSLTAAVVIWQSGRTEVWAACGDTPNLLERGRSDGVGSRYVQMKERGELVDFPGRVTPVDQFLSSVAANLGRLPVMAGADRYRRAEVQQALSQAGLNWPMEWRGQGASATADGSADVRAFQRMVYGRSLKVAPSLLLRSSIAESAIRYDGSGNPALEKARSKGRIDALQAGVIAAGLWERHLANRQPRRKLRYALAG